MGRQAAAHLLKALSQMSAMSVESIISVLDLSSY
jgi:hypothetical protein